MINKIIKFDNDTQYSINLNLDYLDKYKKNSYIPTSKSVEIIYDIVQSLKNNNKSKSKILIGPYGKGKSHLALYIIGLLADKKRSEEEYKLLLNKTLEIDNNKENQDEKSIHEEIKEFVLSEKRYLPVILNATSYNKNFNDILIYGLKQALKIHEIDNIEFNFYFEKAINKIDTWKEKYLTTYEQFKDILKEDIDEFIEKLNRYDKTAYEKFKKLYTNLTSGETFDPSFEVDPIEIYKSTSEQIKKYGFDGIFMFYDEFSKYIEYLIAENAFLDIKSLQDFSEFCNRSDENQIHMLLISHKSINQYINNIDKTKVDAWKAIEGRFEEIQYNDFLSQQYEIIASCIKKDENIWDKYKSKNKYKFQNRINNGILRNLFKDLRDGEFENWIVYGSYPIHPVVTYCLPRISERVAQNERTLFSFLRKNELNSLNDYIKKTNSEVNLDLLYDYFESDIINLEYNDELYKTWRKTNDVLQKIETPLEKKIIKSISIMQMINNFSVLKPNSKIIEEMYPAYESKNTLEKLIEKNIVIERKSNNTLDIVDDRDIEIFTEIKNIKENNKNTIELIDFLNKTFNNIFIESRRHNDEKCIIRYFKVKFLEDENINNAYIKEDLNQENSDGIIYIINNLEDNLLEINEIEEKRVIFISNVLDINFIEELYNLWAIKKLKTNKNIYSGLKIELENLEKELEDKIIHYIEDVLDFKMKNTAIYNKNKHELENRVALSKLISDIMNSIYKNTPIINNEMINKNNISSVVAGARRKIVEQILNPLNNGFINFRKGSLESTLVRSVLLLNGALEQIDYKEGKYSLNYSVLDLKCDTVDSDRKDFNKILKEIKNKILLCSEEETCFKEIYEYMTSHEYGFGMKKGPIPIVLAFVLNKYRKYISIKKDGMEVLLNADILENINLQPENYTIKLEQWDNEKANYIKSLENIFQSYIDENIKNYGNFIYITMAMKKWFLYLSKYAKDTKHVYLGNEKLEKLDKNTVKFKNKLRILNENSIEFLFKDILGIFEFQNDYNELIKNIEKTKHELEAITENLYLTLINDVKRIFEFTNQGSLNNNLYEWKENVSLKAVHTKFEESLLKLIDENKDNNNSTEYLNKLSYCLLGIYISDWNDNTPVTFYNKLKGVKENIENNDVDSDNVVSLDINSPEIAITKSFEKIDKLSDRAEMLLDDLKDTLEDYGSSISESEKKYVILKLLDLME